MRGPKADNAFNRAVKLLRYRARSEAEIRKKLQQLGFSDTVTASTLKKLRDLKLLDDAAFASNWALSRVEGQSYGPLRVDKELRQKGIAQPIISQILDELFGQQQGKQKARLLLEKKFGHKDLTEPKILRRAIVFLQRRGYRDSIIAAILPQSAGDDEMEGP
jgi:regulatory protein